MQSGFIGHIYHIKNNAKIESKNCYLKLDQTKEINYYKIYVPIVQWLTTWTILALTTRKDWKVKQMDVNTTFLNGKLEENVFMEILEGFEGHGNPYLVYKLRRVLYGLHQPPQAWYNHIDKSWH